MLQFIFPDTNSAKKTTLRNSLSITMTSKSRHASLRGTTGRPPSGFISFCKTPFCARLVFWSFGVLAVRTLDESSALGSSRVCVAKPFPAPIWRGWRDLE